MTSNFDLIRRLNYKIFPSDENFQVIQSKFYQNVRRDFIEISFMRHRLDFLWQFFLHKKNPSTFSQSPPPGDKITNPTKPVKTVV